MSRMPQLVAMPGMPGLSALGMMSLLSAQQGLTIEDEEKKSADLMFRKESPTEDTSKDNIEQEDDICCILCGLKESSVDKLKDHINMHFIEQVKKRRAEDLAEMNMHKKLKNNDLHEDEKQTKDNKTFEEMTKPNDKRIKCDKCNISFGNLTTFEAHVKHYCNNRKE